MALNPRLRTINPDQLPIDKIPVAHLQQVIPSESPLGIGLKDVAVEQSQGGPQLPAPGGNEVIGLLGVPDTSQADPF